MKKIFRRFDQEVIDALINYAWPGNVRELENAVERAVILYPFESINLECLPQKLRKAKDEEPRIASRIKNQIYRHRREKRASTPLFFKG
ncbi:MAG: hypothetical protein KKE17_09190 [Proteobacteria bacterium]|nr:hypothetical protein [Pseudomonadota bacterium]MBU1710163.1 hypothetical protein [Pseudomonadota bacterium]